MSLRSLVPLLIGVVSVGCAHAQLPAATGTSIGYACSSSRQDVERAYIDDARITSLASRFTYYSQESHRLDAGQAYLDYLFAAQWFSNGYAESRYFLNSTDGSSDPHGVSFICEERQGSLYSALSLGLRIDVSAELTPEALRRRLQRMQRFERSGVLIYADSSVRKDEALPIADTLRSLETVLGVSAVSPASLLLFGSEAAMKDGYPAMWRDGKPSEISITPPGLPGIAFLSRRRNGFSAHELVHVAAAGWKSRSAQASFAVPYLAEEALARALGGSLGRPLSELTADWRRDHTIEDFAALARSDAQLSEVRLVAGSSPPIEIDILAALYRVAATRCASFPVASLVLPSIRSLSTVVRSISLATRLPEDELVKLAFTEMETAESPTQRSLGSRSACAS